MEKRVRGNSVGGMARFIQTLDPDTARKVREQLTPEQLAQIESAKPNEFYPVELSAACARAIGALYSDPEERYQQLIKVGRFIADDAINTFLRLLVKFLTPSLFARKFGDFFRKDHTFGEITTDLSEIDQKRFVLEMSGVAGYDYMAATSTGWMLHTLEAMGCKNVQVKETLSPPPGPQNVDRYRFEVTWS